MSNVYKLQHRDGSIPYQKITTGRRWVGRVVKHATEPHYLGIIGQTTAKGRTAVEAFDEVVAQHLGYASADALHARNARVRQGTRLVNQAADHVAAEYLNGNVALTDKVLKTPQGALLLLRGMTRSMHRK